MKREKALWNSSWSAISKQISSSSKYLSTTAFSKELGISSRDLLVRFEKLDWIKRENEDWILTDLEKRKGG
jgi:hypothetical protein